MFETAFKKKEGETGIAVFMRRSICWIRHKKLTIF